MLQKNVSRTYLIKGLEYLGQGVNIFDEAYLAPANDGKIIDVDENNVTQTPIRHTDVTEIAGRSYAEFIEKFAVSAGVEGSYGGFSGSVESKFSSSSFESVETQYAQLSLISSGFLLSLGTDPAVLKRSLNADFKTALASADPQDLFKAYGTHVAVKVKTGGMISYYSYSKSTVKMSESDFELAAKCKYEGFGASVGANAALSDKQKQLAEQVNGSDHLFVNGGDTAARTQVEQGSKDSYTAWAQTVDDNPGFLGFEQDGLLPIWKLCEDENRAQAIELAFRQLAARKLQVRIFAATGAVANHPSAQVQVPDKYKMIAGGAWDHYSEPGNLLTASFPSGNNVWIARGKDHQQASPAAITAYALAVYDPLDIWEVSQAQATGERAPHPTATVALDPTFVADGGVLVGGGAIVNWSGGGNLLTASYPSDAKSWQARAKDHNESDPSTITVYAIGLRSKVDGVTVSAATKSLTSPKAPHPSTQVTADSGYTMTGGGALVDWTGNGNLLTSSYPADADTWAASSKDHFDNDPSPITAYAIGVKVN